MWNAIRSRIGAVVVCLLVMTASESFGARLALVIGNDSYQRIPTLRNARADAQAIGAALGVAGFQVRLALDQDRVGMSDALRSFRNSITSGDEVVLFYAGHGVEFSGTNYLLPLDMADDGGERIADDAIALQRVLGDIAQRRPRFSLIIVDACRDEPFKGQGRNLSTRGLTPVAAARGQMVVYSAGAGERALDRLGDTDRSPNSIFTRVFVQEMSRIGVPVHEMVRKVRVEVARLASSVGHEQVPAIYDQALGDFFFSRSKTALDSESGSVARDRMPEPAIVAPESVIGSADELAPRVSASINSTDRFLVGKLFRECDSCPEMLPLPGGDFDMGSGNWEGRSNERPIHRVTVRPFALGRLELTQGQWKALMGTNPSRNSKCGDDCPVENVSWDDAHRYIARLNRMLSGSESRPYRLPSEAEWEYACRAGRRQTYCGSGSVDSVAWFASNSGEISLQNSVGRTQSGGRRPANAFGLHDMSGNSWEWVEDCWNDGYRGAPVEGSPWLVGNCNARVVRGGSAMTPSSYVRAAFRDRESPGGQLQFVGFRVARSIP